MKKIYIFLFLISSLLFSCNSNQTSNSSLETSSKNYDDYSPLTISLSDMYAQEDDSYAVYFFSYYCAACTSLTDLLFAFLDNNNRCIENFYLINLSLTEETDFNKMKSGNAMFDDDILASTINATSLEDTYFKSTPCIYFIEKKESVNTLTNVYLTYPLVYQLFSTNQLNSIS